MEKLKRMELAKEIYEKSENLILDLYSRWSCEKEYEDFNDYIKIVKSFLEKFKIEFVKMTKSFKITYILDDCVYELGMERKSYFYRRIK